MIARYQVRPRVSRIVASKVASSSWARTVVTSSASAPTGWRSLCSFASIASAIAAATVSGPADASLAGSLSRDDSHCFASSSYGPPSRPKTASLAPNVGLEHARLDQHDANPEVTDLVVQRLAEPFDAELRGRVEAVERRRDPPGERRHVHDRARLALAHLRQHRLDHADHAEHVGLEHAANLGEWHRLDRADHAEAGVVDEHVDLTRGGNRGRDRLVGVDVEGERRGDVEVGEGLGAPRRRDHLEPRLVSSTAVARPIPVEQPVTRARDMGAS